MGDPAPSPRVDAHVHLSQWWPEIRRTAYRPTLDYSVRGLLAEMNASRLGWALAIQLFQAPSAEAALAEGERWWSESGGRLLPIATVDPTGAPDAVAATIARWDALPHLAGIKLFPGYQAFYPHDPRVAPVYEFAGRRNLPVLFHQGDTLDGLGLLKFARPLEVDEVAGRYRDVRFVLCHLGNPWIDEAAELMYKNPNVHADTSGLLPPPTSRYFAAAFDRAVVQVHGAIVTVGAADRFLYGSDWPLEALDSATLMIEKLPIPTDDQVRILGGNAARLFGIRADSAPPARRGTAVRRPAPG